MTSCLTALLWLTTASAVGQDTGTIAGLVVDSSEQVVPGATVTLVDEATAATRTVATTERGAFAFQAVKPGTYTVRIELAGFRTLERRSNVLSASGHMDLGRLTLEVGALTETVSVQASGTQVETTNSDHSALLTAVQIENIQTKGRDVMSLLRLLPGARYEDDIEALGESFGSQVPNIGGQRRAWNSITVDGVIGNEVGGSNRFSSAINLDAIAEVKVLLNTYKAEYGRSGGANVQIVSKSGSMQYRGSAYYYGRRDQWNANRWENKRVGLPKPEYVYDTYGANIGGPVKIPGLFEPSDKKLFFFYSMEAPLTRNPGPLRRYLMPTEAERGGDFSQSFDSSGRLRVVVDPMTREPFPHNIIPSDRFDPNGLALLRMLPMPNFAGSRGQYNFVRQETASKPKLNNLFRLDWKRSANDSLFATLRTFNSTQTGSEITAGPAKWGFFNAKYIFSDSSIAVGHTHIFGSNVVNELSGGVKRQTEGFQTGGDENWKRLRKADIGYTLTQFHPELNTLGIIPRVTFGLGVSGSQIDSPDFTFDQRIGETDPASIYLLRDTITWSHGTHTFKAGGYLDFMENLEARGGNWTGEFRFNRDINSPFDTGFAFSNALLGAFSQYSETDAYRRGFSRGLLSEWFAQDTWRPINRLTVDYGVRFLYYTPWWRPDRLSANFRPDLFDATQVPRLYQPALIGGRRMAYDPVTGQTLNPIYVGAFVPGTGSAANGMEIGTNPDVPKSFRVGPSVLPEPRIGFAYDLFGDGKTALHVSAGQFHNARLGHGSLGDLAGNPPFIHSNSIDFGLMSTMFQPGGTTPMLRPSSVNAISRHANTPTTYNVSAGVQRDIGWGTVVDVTVIRTEGRYLEMQTNLNAVPDGARFVDVHPENVDSTNGRALPSEFLRPYRGYNDIFVRDNWGFSHYTALQVQMNRRYSRGVQFGAAYTLSRAEGIGDDDPSRVSQYRPIREWNFARATYDQTHNLVINYSWNLPDVRGRWKNRVTRLALDGWQMSGELAFVKGDWAAVTMTTEDNFDFTGGDGGTGGSLGGGGDGLRVVRPRLIGTPVPRHQDPIAGWIDPVAFARPSGRGDYGNGPRTVIQRPGINNWNAAAFKNFALGRSRRLQFRLETYNVLNHLQFSDIDRNVRFDVLGNQVNGNFGKARSSRQPRVVQLSLRLNY